MEEKEYNEGDGRHRSCRAPSKGLQAAGHDDRIQEYLERAKGGFLVLAWLSGRSIFERLFQHVPRKKKVIELLTSFTAMALEPSTISRTEVRH